MNIFIPLMVIIFFLTIQACFPPFIPNPPLSAPQIIVAVANPNQPLTTSPCRFDWNQVQVTGLVAFIRYSVMLKQGDTVVQKLRTTKNTATIPLPPMTATTPHTFEVQAVAWFGNGISEVGKLAITIGATTPAPGSLNPGQNLTQQNGNSPGQQTGVTAVVRPVNPHAPQYGQQHPSGPQVPGPQIPSPQNPVSKQPQLPGSESSAATWKPSEPESKPKKPKEPKRKATPEFFTPFPLECAIAENAGNHDYEFAVADKGIYQVHVYEGGDLTNLLFTEEINVTKLVGLPGRSKQLYTLTLHIDSRALYQIHVFAIDNSETMKELSDRAKVFVWVGTPPQTVPDCQWDKKFPMPTITSPKPSPCRANLVGEVTIKWKVAYYANAYVVRYREDNYDWKDGTPGNMILSKYSYGRLSFDTQTYKHSVEWHVNELVVQVAAVDINDDFLSEWASVHIKFMFPTNEDKGLKECKW